MTPYVTVLMPVYNGEKYLKEAIDSILNQTFTDFEFLIVNDSSIDRSVNIIESYKDSRIHLVHNKVRRGLPIALNRGIDLARGNYIARMDCDDISLPDRLAKQVNFMDTHPQIGVAGTWIEHFGANHAIIKFATDPEVIRCSLLFGNYHLAHPTIIMRKAYIKANNLYYNPSLKYSQYTEDTELWNRCCNYFLLSNVPEVLLKYRIRVDHHTVKREKIKKDVSKCIARRNLIAMGINPLKEDLVIHDSIRTLSFKKNYDSIKKIEQWLERLHQVNYKNNHYSELKFLDLLAGHWFKVCYASTILGPWVWKRYWQSSLSMINCLSLRFVKFGIKCFLKMP